LSTDDAIKNLILASRPFSADPSKLCLGSITLITREQSKRSNDMAMGMGAATGHGAVLHHFHSISLKDTLQVQLQASSNEYGTDDAIKTLMSASRPFNAVPSPSMLCLCSHTLVREQSKQSNDMGMGVGAATGHGHGAVLHHSISVTDTL